jgi:hypothetical protein
MHLRHCISLIFIPLDTIIRYIEKKLKLKSVLGDVLFVTSLCHEDGGSKDIRTLHLHGCMVQQQDSQ